MTDNNGCCSGSCGSCSGCGTNELILTEKELDLLTHFGEIPFYPIVRNLRTDTTEILDSELSGKEYADALAALEFRGLVSIDNRIPLSGCDYSGYGIEYDHGSAALTAAGQRLVEQLELFGIEEI
ncbi:MAG: hypothetical protein E7430_08640 [Ruminococcaceae bacterium]|nr:hypothetical protein [Oscillospiraceae bacterium]